MNDHFPIELLDQSDQDRINYFRRLTIAHPHHISSLKEVEKAIDDHDDTHIALVLGCTGTGKTTLINKIVEKVWARTPEAESDESIVPIVSFEAIGPDSGSVNMKAFMKSYLRSIHEPMIDKKKLAWQSYESRGFNYDPWHQSFYELEESVINALRHRRPSAVIIDEAHHLTKVTTARRLQDHLDVLKTIANRSETLHILVGTYELLRFRNLSGQLSRRSVDIHLKRYRYEIEEEFKIFKNIIHTFEAHMPLREESQLQQHADLLYERSVGCVGILKIWLKRALRHALRKNQEKVTLEDLQETSHSVAQCQKIATEALEGESQMTEDESTQKHLRMLLGIIPPDSGEKATHLGLTAVQKGKRRNQVGKPLPKIHPVGPDNAA